MSGDAAGPRLRAAPPCSAVGGDAGRRAAVLSPADGERATRCAATILPAAVAVGFVTGFFGVGGGFVIVPALVILTGLQLPVAVGTSLLVIAVNSAGSLAVRAGELPDLQWRVIAVVTGSAVVGSLVGQRFAARVPAARLAVAFTALLVGVAGYTGIRALSPLPW